MSKKFLMFLLKLAVAVMLTALLIDYTSPSKIMLVLHTANLLLILTIVPLVLLCMWLAALQFKILTDCHGMNVGLMRITSSNSSTELYSLFCSGLISGKAICQYRLSKHYNMQAQALASPRSNNLAIG